MDKGSSSSGTGASGVENTSTQFSAPGISCEGCDPFNPVLSDFSVLIVDDDNTCRSILHATVSKQLGIMPMLAENGKVAVEHYRAGNFFNIVFMDMEMPVMNGPQATKELREMGIPSMIVGLTSDDEEKAREEFMAAGLDKCLKKPLTPSMLQEIEKEYDDKFNGCIYCRKPRPR